MKALSSPTDHFNWPNGLRFERHHTKRLWKSGAVLAHPKNEVHHTSCMWHQHRHQRQLQRHSQIDVSFVCNQWPMTSATRKIEMRIWRRVDRSTQNTNVISTVTSTKVGRLMKITANIEDHRKIVRSASIKCIWRASEKSTSRQIITTAVEEAMHVCTITN